MDLDALKQKSMQITAPPINEQNLPAGMRSVDDLITLLKESDEVERKKLRKSLPFFVIAALIFAVAFIAVIVPGGASLNPSTLLLRGMLMILYAFIAVSVWTRMRGIARIDYAEPVRSFLAKAEKRYAFGTKEVYVFAFAVTLFLGYGAFLYVSDVLRRHYDITVPWVGLLVALMFVAAVYVFGFWATRKDWKKEKQDIWLQVKKMREEWDREESNGNS
jgi:hypothetical protein